MIKDKSSEFYDWDEADDCFKFTEKKFLSVIYEKIKAGGFDGSQIELLMKDTAFQ